MPGRLILLATSHRVAPGLLTWDAWEALRGAGRVYVESADHPQLPALRAAGIEVEQLPADSLDETARRLLDESQGAAQENAQAGVTVIWLVRPGGHREFGDALARALLARWGEADLLASLESTGDEGQGPAPGIPEVEALQGSYDLPGARLLDVVSVMDRLRSPGGCPWDGEQTHESLRRYLLEEAYETVEAIETGDRDHLREELGDILLQVAFHSRIAEEHPDEPWSIDDVAGDIVDKLIRRHPHVFGDVHAPTAEHVEANWDQLKAAEKQRDSAVAGVPMGQPALSLASKLISRAENAGLAVEVPARIGEPERVDDQAVGELLLAVAVLAHAHKVDPEEALRAAARRFRDRAVDAERTGSNHPT